AFQNTEKENRAAELLIANNELAFQNTEKENRAAELLIANNELAFQNKEKENRAAELLIANTELAFQNTEKENRAAELLIANNELAFQNTEKERQAAELIVANNELKAFTFISSHDLQEPLRKIQTFASRILENEYEGLSEKGKDYFNRMHGSARRMQTLIADLLAYSHTNITERKFEKTDLDMILKEVKNELSETLIEKNALIKGDHLGEAYINPFQFRQVMNNLLTNALKFSKEGVQPYITIKTRVATGRQLQNEDPLLSAGSLSSVKKYTHISCADNGIGFDPQYKHRIFEVFQRLHLKELYEGTGIGLAIVKKIIENHNGIITASGKLNEGATFDIYIPLVQNMPAGEM
ncbi:MAG: ATP-binding protein, partial [Ferruginibacter sp.]